MPVASIVLLAALLALPACGSPDPVADESAKTVDATVEDSAREKTVAYVGVAVCTECHADQAEAWSGSHHDLAMRPADEASVRGDFDDALFTHRGVDWRFYRRDGRFFVTTEGSDGTPSEFEVLYTFGVEPLQQYLVALDGGRLHALTAAWDSRPAAEGGGRWFSLHGDESVAAGDVLHWTGPAQHWNTMCADCHSTAYEKGYDPRTRSYRSSWSDVNVGCEACHGAGSEHVERARSGAGDAKAGLVRDLASIRNDWVLRADQPIAFADGTAVRGAEVDTCAPCHARRSTGAATPDDASFLDSYRPSLLSEGLYYADGQILDEVYVWGSFLQSRMYAAGVTCSDCHDPHSLRTRADGNGLCAKCHASTRYDAPAHHHHEADSAGSRCIDCHMPERTYMQIDRRRDHSFRVPRPDLSVEIGVPNACTGCHTDRSADWAASQVSAWPNVRQAGTPHFGQALARARSGNPQAARELSGIVAMSALPAIVRATALVELADLDPARTASAVNAHLDDDEALMRYAAARAGATLPADGRLALLLPLVTDPVRLVRAEAGRALAGLPSASLTEADRANIAAAVETYAESERARRDEPSADVNLGLLHLALGDWEAAEESYREALAVGPHFLPAYINLADLYRQTGRDAEGATLLAEALRRAPDHAEIHHALGLHHVRAKRIDEAIASLGRAVELAPANTRFAYVYAVALDSVDRSDQALRVLREALNHAPDNPTLLQALISISLKTGRNDDASRYMERLRAVAPLPEGH